MVHQTNRQRSLGIDDLSAENHFHRFAFADHTAQSVLPTTARNDSEIDFRLSERSLIAGNAQVAGQRPLTTAAQTITVDHRDYGLGKTVDSVEQRPIEHDFALLYGGPLGK